LKTPAHDSLNSAPAAAHKNPAVVPAGCRIISGFPLVLQFKTLCPCVDITTRCSHRAEQCRRIEKASHDRVINCGTRRVQKNLNSDMLQPE